MTKQLYSLPNLDTKSGQNFLALTKYSAKKKLRKSVLQMQDGDEDGPLTPHSMRSDESEGNNLERSKGGKDPNRVRRQESRIAQPGDSMSLATPRLQKEDRTRSEPAIFPPIEAGLFPNTGSLPVDPNNNTGQRSSFKLPAASSYQLYSIGLTYNTGKERPGKEKRTPKKPQTYREINSRRSKYNRLNRENTVKQDTPGTLKFSESDSSFSIRKKIEQYRNWHEEQYRYKLKELKQEAERERHAEAMKIASVHKTKSALKKPTMKFSHTNRGNSYDALLPRIALKLDHNFDSVPKEEEEDAHIEEAGKGEINNSVGDKETDRFSSPAVQAGDITRERIQSSKTWRTWRDVNDSYAYTDVKQYIKDNELMDEEKEKYIEEWVSQVGSVPPDISEDPALELVPDSDTPGSSKMRKISLQNSAEKLEAIKMD